VEERGQVLAALEDAGQVLAEGLELLARRPLGDVSHRGDDVAAEQVHLPDCDRYLVGAVAVHLTVSRQRPHHVGHPHPAAGQRVHERRGPGQSLVDATAPDLGVTAGRFPPVPVGDPRDDQSADDPADGQNGEHLAWREFRVQFRAAQGVGHRVGQLVDELADGRQDEQQCAGRVHPDDDRRQRHHRRDQVGLGGVGPVGLVDVGRPETVSPLGGLWRDVLAEVPPGDSRQARVHPAVETREGDDRDDEQRHDEREEADDHGSVSVAASSTVTSSSSIIATTSSGSA